MLHSKRLATSIRWFENILGYLSSIFTPIRGYWNIFVYESKRLKSGHYIRHHNITLKDNRCFVWRPEGASSKANYNWAPSTATTKSRIILMTLYFMLWKENATWTWHEKPIGSLLFLIFWKMIITNEIIIFLGPNSINECSLVSIKEWIGRNGKTQKQKLALLLFLKMRNNLLYCHYYRDILRTFSI